MRNVLFLEQNVTDDEVFLICKGLNVNKAGGCDSIVYERIKYGGKTLITHITNLFNMIITHEHIPEKWKIGRIITLYKGQKKPER